MSYDPNYTLLSAVREGNVKIVAELIGTYGLSYCKGWSDGYVLLREAVEHNRTDVVELLLESGCKINAKNKLPANSPLHFAIKSNNLKILAMLLDKGADINAINKSGQSPLDLAVTENKTEATELLLTHNANGNEISSRGLSLLHIAAKAGNVKIAQSLLNRGVSIDRLSFSSVYQGEYTPLRCACERGKEEVVKLLLNEGADVNAGTNKTTLLHIAVKMEYDKIARILLERGGIDLDARDEKGKTALSIAVEAGYLPIVKNILEIHPDVNNENNRRCLHELLYSSSSRRGNSQIIKMLLSHGFTVHREDASDSKLLHGAVEKGITDVLEDLLRYGADVGSIHPEKKGYTLLHNAAKNRQLNAAEILIKYGADVNTIDETKKFPISYAVENIDVKMAKLLVSKGANIKYSPDLLRSAINMNTKEIIEIMWKHDSNLDVNARDINGRTALHYLASYEKTYSNRYDSHGDYQDPDDLLPYFTEMFLGRGADVNVKDRHGRTALLFACEKNNKSVFATLIEASADIDCQDNDGKTALHIAATNTWPEAVQCLLDHGADVNATCKYRYTPLYSAIKAREVFKSRQRSRRRNYDDDYNDYRDPYEDDHDNWEDQYDDDDHPCNWRFTGTCDILKMHIVKLKSLNRYVSEQNLRHFNNFKYEFEDFNRDCEDEVEKMKNEKIGDSNISFHDLLIKSKNQLSILARNKSISDVLECSSFREEFPIYNKLLYCNFKKGQKRSNLLSSSLRSLNFLSGVALPEFATSALFDHLSDKDLENLIKAGSESDCGVITE